MIINKQQLFALKIIQPTFSLYSYLLIHPKKATRFKHYILSGFNLLTPCQRMLWWSLIRKQKKFKGQFIYSDKRLSQELHCGINTIKRAKEKLREQQKIIYKSGLYEGSPTCYLIVQELPKKSKIKNQELPIKSIRATQNIIDNNITKEIRFNPETCRLIKESQNAK